MVQRLTQVLTGTLKDDVDWAKEDGREPIVIEDEAGAKRIKSSEAERADSRIADIQHPGASPHLNANEDC